MPTPQISQQVPRNYLWTGLLMHSPKCCSNAGETTSPTLHCTVIFRTSRKTRRADDACTLRRKRCRTARKRRIGWISWPFARPCGKRWIVHSRYFPSLKAHPQVCAYAPTGCVAFASVSPRMPWSGPA